MTLGTPVKNLILNALERGPAAVVRGHAMSSAVFEIGCVSNSGARRTEAGTASIGAGDGSSTRWPRPGHWA
jgi:hypothetical protein